MKFIKKLFQQKKSFLFNGEKVRENDFVVFFNSDGIECVNEIKRRDDGTLFFWNANFEISDYRSAKKCTVEQAAKVKSFNGKQDKL